MYGSNATSQGNPLTRHIIKSNDSIAPVLEAVSPLIIIQFILINDRRHTVHESCWDQRVSENFCRRFLLRLFAIKYCRRFGDPVMKFIIYLTVSV